MSYESRLMPGTGKRAGIVGVPLGFGAGTRGSELGTAAMRMTRFRGRRLQGHLSDLGYDIRDFGDAEITEPDFESEKQTSPKYIDEIFASSESIVTKVKSVLEEGYTPLILGGDHSIAAATLSAVSTHYKEQEEEIGLIWFDAHADINTPETSPSGNTHGMPFATILGMGEERMVGLGTPGPKFDTKYVAHIGARDLDAGEKRIVHELGLRNNFFTMTDIDRLGMAHCVERAIEIAGAAPGGFAVTFDVDVIDPRFAPGSGTLVRGGITYREAHLALELIHETNSLRSFEIVEVNPILDASNVTTEVACELILSAMGNVVL